jgi:nitrogen fixation-related uncharacterized protein
LTLVVLAGASIIAVFLIALDQVWPWQSHEFDADDKINIDTAKF